MTKTKDYYVTIASASKELSGIERIKIKDTKDCISLNDLVEVEPYTFAPDYYATLEIHNEHSENKDYSVIVVVTKDGEKLMTGSPSFITAFENIMDEIVDIKADGGEDADFDYMVKAYTKPSNNFKGKDFITCSLA